MKWKNERVVVFGGSGCLGYAIIRQLLAKGCLIRSFQRSPAPEFEDLGIKVVRGDIRNLEQVKAACRGCTAVIHTAALAGYWGGYRDYYTTNVEGTINVLQACQDHDIRRLVYTSSSSVAYTPEQHVEGLDESAPYPERYLSHYSATKSIAEKHVLGAFNRELSAICLRPHLIWGPGDHYIVPELLRRARKRVLYQVGDGSNMIDLAYVDNVAHAHILALEYLEHQSRFRHAYFISDGAPVNMWGWISELLNKLGEPGVTGRWPLEKAWRVGKYSEKLYRYLPFQPTLTRFLAGHLGYSHYFNINAAAKTLGYKPRVTPEQAMNSTLQWLRNG
mgnify:CR=1 FL=1|jgi:nucleoside-diphosphate-sugar epimerase